MADVVRKIGQHVKVYFTDRKSCCSSNLFYTYVLKFADCQSSLIAGLVLGLHFP